MWLKFVVLSILCVLDYVRARLFPFKNPTTFEQWVTNQFGRRLFENFFKTYTEKVWGMSCKEISADWAAQRISGLSLFSAIKNAILGSVLKKQSSGRVIKTLIDSFRYPRRGPGMMWEVCAQKFVGMGGDLRMGLKVVGCKFDNASAKWTIF
jgi:protoporphyrinogen oxidase